MPDDLRLVRMNHEAKTIIICVKMPTPSPAFGSALTAPL